ncbi:zinc ribbon domain-containing protein [Lentzea sp. DG1S-22]|uniref:zinc ribbon domain-containing protein n=1 Tax=Lentzea sp. DG1S-22 TaxID=3108822 RepID=UPI003FA5494A
MTGIRERVRLRKPQRAMVHSWAFAQLGRFLAYKAERAGVVLLKVDPAHTSQQCSGCGEIDKKNRRSQALGRSHASARSAHPVSQPGRQPQAWWRP